MVGFTKKKSKKEENKDDTLSDAANRLNKKEKKKAKKKAKRAAKKDGAEKMPKIEVELNRNDLKGNYDEKRNDKSTKQKNGKSQALIIQEALDSIEQHREKYNKSPEDCIEKHREEYENVQIMPTVQDWYEQESLAMDLESLKRKPWYKKNREEKIAPKLHQTVGAGRDCHRGQNGDDDDSETEESSSEEEEVEEVKERSRSGKTTTTPLKDHHDYNRNKASVKSRSIRDNTVWVVDQEPEYEFIHHCGVPVGVRTIQVVEDETERLNYARQSLARLEKIEEIRKSRERLKVEMKAKKQRRKKRHERARRSKQLEQETRRAQKQYGSQQNYYSQPRFSSRPDPPMMLLDLTDVCDHRMGGVTRPLGQSSAFGRKHDIKVIVDLTDRKNPQPVLDLTKVEEPPFDLHFAPPSPNRRLENLRRDREKKLSEMTNKFDLVKTKKASTTTRRNKSDTEPSPYAEMMQRVTRNVEMCG